MQNIIYTSSLFLGAVLSYLEGTLSFLYALPLKTMLMVSTLNSFLLILVLSLIYILVFLSVILYF